MDKRMKNQEKASHGHLPTRRTYRILKGPRTGMFTLILNEEGPGSTTYRSFLRKMGELEDKYVQISFRLCEEEELCRTYQYSPTLTEVYGTETGGLGYQTNITFSGYIGTMEDVESLVEAMLAEYHFDKEPDNG